MILTLLFCSGCITYLMVWGQGDSRLQETIAYGLFGTFISTLGSYLFGATWDDKNVMQIFGKEAYRDSSSRTAEFEQVDGPQD